MNKGKCDEKENKKNLFLAFIYYHLLFADSNKGGSYIPIFS